jgi:hypothetical protein
MNDCMTYFASPFILIVIVSLLLIVKQQLTSVEVLLAKSWDEWVG